MTTVSPSDQKQLASWDAHKQQSYRQAHQGTVLTFHFLLDESPSMLGDEARNLRTAYNMYLAWLQRHADPMSLAEVRCFSGTLSSSHCMPLGMLKSLTTATYNPANGDGTALYTAVGDTCTTAAPDGQHVLIVFTDGKDNMSAEWTASKLYMLLKTLQEEHQWLCVFLGAFPDALDVGRSMGFAEGNMLVFTADQIPDAFKQLQVATGRYLDAPAAQRKQLAAGGIF